MELIGPLANVSTNRTEGKHQEGKLASRVANSRVNINHTIAMRIQLKLNFKFFSPSTIASEFSIGPFSSENICAPSIVSSYDIVSSNNLKLLKWLKRQEFIIKRDTILILFEPHGARFYEVYGCYCCQQSGKILVVTKTLNHVYFDEHFDAYKVFINESSDWKIFTTSEIGAGLATITYKVKLNDNYYYIPKRYI